MKLQGNVLKRNSMRFAAALLGALASFIAGPNAALAASPQHHDQAPGFFRLKVGDLEVTALFDGAAAGDAHWLNGTKATMDGVVNALHEDQHMLEAAGTGFLVNTGKQLILVDAGAGAWWGGGALGTESASSQMPMFTSRRRKATFGCRQKSLLKRRRMRNRSFRVRKPSQRRTSRPVSGTRLVAPSQSSTACNSSRCMVIPRDIPATNSRQRDKNSCFGATSSMHSASSCSIPRSPRFSTSTRLRLRRRGNNCCLSSRARMF